MNHSKHLEKEYNESLSVQAAKLLWTVTKYNPFFVLAKYSLTTYFNMNKYFWPRFMKWVPYINQIDTEDLVSQRKVETFLNTLFTQFFSEDTESVPSGRAFIKKNRSVTRHVEIRLTQVGIYREEEPGEMVSDSNMTDDEDDEEEVMRLDYEETTDETEE